MNKEAVQHERGPRNSTLKRQMAMLSGIARSKDYSSGSSHELSSTDSIVQNLGRPNAAKSNMQRSLGSNIFTPTIEKKPKFGPFNGSLSSMANSFPIPPTSSGMPSSSAFPCSSFNGLGVTPTLFGNMSPFAARITQQQTRTLNVDSTIFRLLNWSRSLLAFVPGLSLDEQISIVSSSISRLFLLTAIEDNLLNSASLDIDETGIFPLNSQAQLTQASRKRLIQLISLIESIQFDAVEFNLLRVLLLLKEKMPQMQQLIQLNLAHHQQISYQREPLRYARSMVVVDSLLSLDTNSLVTLLSNRSRVNNTVPLELNLNLGSPNTIQTQDPIRQSAKDLSTDKMTNKWKASGGIHPFSVYALAEIGSPRSNNVRDSAESPTTTIQSQSPGLSSPNASESRKLSTN
ncbi:protein tailless [Ditylenchus destructor]|uniref:Protein tailless n=1 Tax=Ditylenchus destructor TaxID=166010 RepID=A0AAD4N3R2_9BILA|nr:protein tailless [Ditylenchus destructor]